jgi:hypothetical protein
MLKNSQLKWILPQNRKNEIHICWLNFISGSISLGMEFSIELDVSPLVIKVRFGVSVCFGISVSFNIGYGVCVPDIITCICMLTSTHVLSIGWVGLHKNKLRYVKLDLVKFVCPIAWLPASLWAILDFVVLHWLLKTAQICPESRDKTQFLETPPHYWIVLTCPISCS